MATLGDLPEDVLHEILSRLPAKSLLRCRAVCKAFRILASDRRLLLEHHRRQPPQPLVYCPCDVGGGAIDFHLEAVDLLHAGTCRSVIRFIEKEDYCFNGYDQGQLTFHGSYGGLLLISFTDCLYLCNPATRQWAPVPSLASNEIAGLYEHGPTEEYRILYHRGEGRHKFYYVLTVGSDEKEGRNIGRPASSAFVDDELMIGPPPACWQPPVLLSGNLHWPPQGESTGNNCSLMMLVFDTVTEVFSWLCAPPIAQFQSVPVLFDMDGMLALSTDQTHTVCVNLWVLQDYVSQTWVPTHIFQLEVVKVSIASFDVLDLAAWFIVSRQGDVLVECTDRCSISCKIRTTDWQQHSSVVDATSCSQEYC